MVKAKRSVIRAIVVDDSPTAQKLLVTILQEAEGIEVVGIGKDGEDAVRLAKRLRPDVVTMDVRMPKMDGLEATRRIMHETPTPIVIVTADLMQADMNLTFEALRAGALTVVGKPGLADTETCTKVIQTVRLMADVPVVHHWDRREWRPPEALETMHPSAPAKTPVPPAKRDVQQRIQMIGIASSTGGPATLAKILGQLPADFPVPILVVQHVTNGFVSGLAEWLDSVTSLHVGLASHGEMPSPGTILFAPDDYHIQVNGQGIVELYKGPPYKGLRPSANYLFHSLARAYAHRVMGVVLTGMGDDGAEGLLAIRQAGGLTLAQDEQTCVVYGMPREAVALDAVDQVLPLDQIAQALDRMAKYPSEL
ncbi:MAG: chemotaxis-specific protein-glutamate methyltransferase CheB [Anaerolineae bacterium]